MFLKVPVATVTALINLLYVKLSSAGFQIKQLFSQNTVLKPNSLHY